jgi:hypothetical protein
MVQKRFDAPECQSLWLGWSALCWTVGAKFGDNTRMLEYKGFLIEPFETEPGRWRAEITRPDGRKIKTFPDGQEHDFIRTGGAEAFSAQAAIKVAMRLIDGGGMD